MKTILSSWRMVRPGEALEIASEPLPAPGPGEVLLRVLACGLCHTDFAFLYGGVRTRAEAPLTLGHEIVGRAEAVGDGVDDLVGQSFVVPAVLPCGECELCRKGRGNVCLSQKMPGNDFHGGFASHLIVPARFLCPASGDGPQLEALAVVADAVSTAYQSVLRTDAGEGDVAIVVGAGGVGTFAAQTAKARGAHVVAIDVDANRLEQLADLVDLPIVAEGDDPKPIRKAVTGFEKERGLPAHGRRILECSGTASGQQTAFALVTHDSTLCVVGFTLDKVPVRLSNLMAFDATVFGNWGCLPEHYGDILKLVESGKIAIEPFVERFPMSQVNDLLRQEHHARRPVLIPDFED